MYLSFWEDLNSHNIFLRRAQNSTHSPITSPNNGNSWVGNSWDTSLNVTNFGSYIYIIE